MKVLWIVGALLLVVGLGMLAGGVAVWRSHAAFAAHAASADGTVTDLTYSPGSKGSNSGTYRPVIEFDAPGGKRVHVTGSSGSNPPAYSRGDHVRVLFDPANPEHAQIDSFMEQTFPLVLMFGLGSIFTLAGAGTLRAQMRRRKVQAWLTQYGMKVQAKFTGVDLDTGTSVNGRHPWRLNAQWQHPGTGKVYSFRSDPIWFDPSAYVTRDTLDVTVNADDPRQYAVDTAFLPQAG